jgi:uncharacterized radical SAM protein YgiQ
MNGALPQPRFLPTTAEEVHALGWSELDVIIVTGDTYIDSAYIGAAVIGRVLVAAGFRVGILAQPDIIDTGDIARLGEPRLFWGVTAGSLDSMVANYTALGKPRRSDDLTPGGRNDRRPDRAALVYSNLIRRRFKSTQPIVLGGVEASLRRISHYDAWSDRVRRAILFDAKADLLLYGMAEQSAVALAQALDQGGDITALRGICYISKTPPEPQDRFGGQDIELPPHSLVAQEQAEFVRMFDLFYANSDPQTAKRLYQRQDTRYLVQNPPAYPTESPILDQIHELPYAREAHPFYGTQGAIRALETIRFGLITHRGCYGECRFCAIAVHQGRQVVSRSQASLLREAGAMTIHPAFKGVIPDVGGPTANMYAIECKRKQHEGACRDRACLHPSPCPKLPIDHTPQIELLRALHHLPGVRHVFIGSGVRHDLLIADRKAGQPYLEEILTHHVSGQLKIAPEHVQAHLLDLMAKPGPASLETFLGMFARARRKLAKQIYLTYYLMAAYPGCSVEDMHALKQFSAEKLHVTPEQIQIFTPSPSTWATLMYYTGIDPFSGRTIFVERNPAQKRKQKEVFSWLKQNRRQTGRRMTTRRREPRP